MARVVLMSLSLLKKSASLHVLYSPSKYKEPSRSLVPIRHAGAVHPTLAGQIASPDSSRLALMGLGYDYGVALNILETHEPDISFIFRPNGPDEKFASSVAEANFGFDFGERNYDIIDYYLNDMAGAYD